MKYPVAEIKNEITGAIIFLLVSKTSLLLVKGITISIFMITVATAHMGAVRRSAMPPPSAPTIIA